MGTKPNIPRSVPSGISLPWMLALIGGGFVSSLLGLALVTWIGPVTLRGVIWASANLVMWVALCLLLAGTEEPKVTWIVARSARLVQFSSLRSAKLLPKREIAIAACFWGLLVWNWVRTFADGTVIFVLAAVALGVVRVVRRAPFSRWQWIGCSLLIVHQLIQAFIPASRATSWFPAASLWFEVLLWWMFTHRAVKREDDGLAARLALTQASYFIADGRFAEAGDRVREMLPLAATSEIASAALQVLAVCLAGQARLAEAERALQGSLALDPDNEDTRKRLEEIKRIQMV